MIRGRDRLCPVFRSVLTLLLPCGQVIVGRRLGSSCVTDVTWLVSRRLCRCLIGRLQTFLGHRSLRIMSLLEVEIEL